jgi:hypothetical protein
MEKLKQTIYKLENEVSELRQFQTKLQGSLPAKGDIHYCTSSQEFGEYDLDEIDTFRFVVSRQPSVVNHPEPKFHYATYRYHLLNPTPELSAYLRLQGKHEFSTDFIPVDTEKFEEYCMKGGTPFVLTDEIRKCLDSKLWEFAVDLTDPYCRYYKTNPELYKDIKENFYTDITVPFTNTYTISPHVSFYITPLSNTLDDCVIHEITTKQVVFRIKYGNMKEGLRICDIKRHIYSGLKLHYSINGVVKQNDNLLD